MAVAPSPPSRCRRAAFIVALAAACNASFPVAAFAQNSKSSPEALIQRGSALFDDQQYEESIQVLSAALVRLGSSGTEAEKIEVYRLLAYNDVILKRTDEADAAVRAILVLKESFSLGYTESRRFRTFFDAAKKRWIDDGKPGVVKPGEVVDKPIKMQHVSPPTAPAGVAIKLTGSVEDGDARAAGVQLVYRAGTTAKFTVVAATLSLGQFRAQIPAPAVKPPLVEYYFQAVDKGGLPIASRGDVAAPLRIVVPADASVVKSPFLWVPVSVAIVGGAILTGFFLSRSTAPSAKSTSHVTVNVSE